MAAQQFVRDGANCFNATGIDETFDFSASCVPQNNPGPSLFLVDPTEPFSEHKSRLRKYGLIINFKFLTDCIRHHSSNFPKYIQLHCMLHFEILIGTFFEYTLKHMHSFLIIHLSLPQICKNVFQRSKDRMTSK